MRYRIVLAALALTTNFAFSSYGEAQDATVGSMRARLAELGSYVIEEAEGRAPKELGPRDKRNPREEGLYQLSRAPREPVRQAIDQILKSGSKEERIGALTLYDWIVTPTYGIFEQEPLNPSYRGLALDLLAQDDRKLSTYTNSLASILGLYPISRETIFVYMELAASSTDPRAREDYLLLASDKLGIDLPIYKQTPALERQKILADFEAWFAKNKNQIAFDEKGRSLLAGSKVRARPRSLQDEDRGRIHKDPVCVLQLMQASIGNPASEQTLRGLVKTCGEALFGPEAAALVVKGLDTPQDGSTAALDLQMAIARAQGEYPVTDAVLLAIACVAAYGTDPANRELAKTSLDQFGSPDIPHALKGEPKAVHEAMEALADEVLKR